ncbi:DUF2513 domain-containing protein [Solidesulfovibrio sp.]
MHRDKILLTSILKALESSKQPFASVRYDQFGPFSQEQVIQHMLLLNDNNMIVLLEPTQETSPPFYPMTVRIAWNGHEWLEKNG